MIKKMKEIKPRVEFLLRNYPTLRDDDNQLIANIYFQEAGGSEVLSKMSAIDFIGLFASGKLTNFESIRRVRAKLQEEKPELRGVSYSKRKDLGDDTRKNIEDL